MERRTRQALSRFFLNAFLFSFVRKRKLAMEGGSIFLTQKQIDDLESWFLTWQGTMETLCNGDVDLIDSLITIRPEPITGASNALREHIRERGHHPDALMRDFMLQPPEDPRATTMLDDAPAFKAMAIALLDRLPEGWR